MKYFAMVLMLLSLCVFAVGCPQADQGGGGGAPAVDTGADDGGAAPDEGADMLEEEEVEIDEPAPAEGEPGDEEPTEG